MYQQRVRSDLASCLGNAFLSGGWNEAGLLTRASLALDPTPRWASSLALQVLRAYPRAPLDRARELQTFIELVLRDLPADPEGHQQPLILQWASPGPAMARRRWPVPEIATEAGLAEFFGLSDGALAWMADARRLERTTSDLPLRHYLYRTIPRRSGAVRVIERPKQRLKALQRQILHEILDPVPTHEAAHGFTSGRSVRSHAGTHVGQFAIARFDLKDFFASVAAGRIYGIFRTAGYPESVAYSLTALTTNVVPAAVWHSIPRPSEARLIPLHHELGQQLATPHLPQGAPTSPALANLAAFRLDRRLSGLATALDLRYSRYADDLTFSGSVRLLRSMPALQQAVVAIVRDEGFAINPDKTYLATRAGRQRVCGIVVNERTNVAREEYDTLKAILHNAELSGPASQNRDGRPDFRAHLLGRIAWFHSLNPERGEKLRAQFDQIVWLAAP
jgi:RNA-directed DNA polymerase